MKFRSKFLVPATILCVLGAAFGAAPKQVYRAASDLWGARYSFTPNPAGSASAAAKVPQTKKDDAVERIRHWNQIAIDASGLDHTPVQPGENRVFGEQVGPVRAARAVALVQIAVFEAVNAIDGGCKSYIGMAPAQPGTSMNCAVAQAAHDTLCAMWPSQKATFDAHLADELSLPPNGRPKAEGIML